MISMVELRGVTKDFGSYRAVNNVSLDIRKGELFALLGGSGCGKSTLLRMMGGFESPTSGHVLIDGQDMAGVAPYDRPVSMMFQSYALFPHMTVAKNVAFGLEMEKLPRVEVRQRVAQVLDMVQLTPYAERKPRQLSGGQQQRVALARSLVLKPRLLLLDEPLGALDRKIREKTQLELIQIQEQTGITFVMVTHDQEEAMGMATRIGVMNKGEIVQVGTPHDIYENPSTRFVADFVGDVNLCDGVVKTISNGFAQVDCAGWGTFSVRTDKPVQAGQGVSLAIRPEKIQLATQDLDNEVNHVRGTVKDRVYQGDTSVYIVALEKGGLARVMGTNRFRSGKMPEWDEVVHLAIHPNNLAVLTA